MIEYKGYNIQIIDGFIAVKCKKHKGFYIRCLSYKNCKRIVNSLKSGESELHYFLYNKKGNCHHYEQDYNKSMV